MAYPDFNEFLHALRTRELRKMPAGANVFLSAGCSGRWYFDWINENYPGITKHYGIEAFSPKPDDLPIEVEWLPDYLSNMKSVESNVVDMVFAGQTVEHLWPDDFAGFLAKLIEFLTRRVVCARQPQSVCYTGNQLVSARAHNGVLD